VEPTANVLAGGPAACEYLVVATAADCYRVTLQHKPEFTGAMINLGHALKADGQVTFDDFFTGDKVLRKDDHQAFPLEVIFEMKDGKPLITQTIPGEKTLFPPACKFATT
jgi:hypothetical protein